MNSPSDQVSAVFGVVIGAILVWGTVRIVNHRLKWREVASAVVVAGCLWLPFSWLILMPGGWDDYRLGWLRMWPLLPGLIPGALLFHATHEVLEFSTMAVTTLILLMVLSWLGRRSQSGLLAAAIIALLISVPTAWFAYAAYSS